MEQLSWNDVEKYVEKSISYHAGKFAKALPSEQTEEMAQEARLRVFRKLGEIDEDKGWKSFVSNHVRGACLDYLKAGKGFPENKTGAKILKSRLSFNNDDGTAVDVGEVLGIKGHFNEGIEYQEIKIKWDLISRIASVDDRVYILAKRLLGHTVEEISHESEYSREWVGKKVGELLESFDSAASEGDKCIDQIIYAFGLSHIYGTPNINIGWGDDFHPVDLLEKKEIINKEFTPQIEMF